MLDHSAISLENKVALVTGGGGGIGKSISQTLAHFGARVVVAEQDAQRAKETVDEIRAAGGVALASVVDVQESDQVGKMTDEAFDAYGRVDILVNNVGDHLRLRSKFVESNEDDWEAHYRINLKHVFYVTRAIAPRMIERGEGGSIINISSIEAFRGIPGLAAYSAFNGGITQFTKSLALELGPDRIRVNAIAPETTETLQVQPARMIPEESQWMIPYWIPMGRYGTPDDAAGIALFLASDLSAWVTGTTIHMDGGALAAGGFFRSSATGDWSTRPCVEHSPALRR
jgi:NAD(P)-dependent dehydrogenase (short-subunit alcohol dehydrogenase family)